MVRWSIVSLQVRKQNWSVTLCLFLLFFVYFFDEKTCFLQGRNLGWCFCSSLYFLFFCSVFFVLFFFGLIALFFWVFCCCRVLWVALFLGSSSSSFFLYVLCLLLIKTRSLPLISPAFAGLYLPWFELLQIFRSPVESGWRRSHGSPTSNGDVSAKRHIFTFWPLNFGNPAIGPLSN